MARVFAITGTHGSGKSTLLEALKTATSQDIVVDDYKVSRAVQQELNVEDLMSIVKKETKVKDFQELIFEKKLEHDKLLQERPEKIILVERSFFDILAYTQIWLSNENGKITGPLKKWFVDYKQRLIDAQNIYDGHIFVHTHKNIPFEYDPNRATLESRTQFEQLMIQYDKTYGPIIKRPDANYTYQKIDIFCHELPSRVELVKSFLNSVL